MVRAYQTLLAADSSLIQGEVFNCGFQNLSISEIAQLVVNIVPEFRTHSSKLTISVEPSDDPRSYHVNSDKISRVLDFVPHFSVDDAIRDLCRAFASGHLRNSFSESTYFNVQRMKELQIK